MTTCNTVEAFHQTVRRHLPDDILLVVITVRTHNHINMINQANQWHQFGVKI
jgi:hypothetical protein